MGVIVSGIFLFWFIPLYHLKFSFSLIVGPTMVMVTVYADDEMLGIFPNFMLKCYQRNTYLFKLVY
ncbi:hypothetical protein RES10_04550 [Staphylococcus cohnii]|nr:hypothetical protein CEQ12_01400 [Staphylococcus cohnii]MDV3052492.1 hypothetical protein [Staphylococcus ureilyticus]OLF32271.1 hypothetical protein BSZ11_07010 [Staphylococcus sp. 47.1]OIS31409.1 hypothetical protein RES9_01960 [Staphylococcus cohnii]OIS32309.1 hypothetical protein RES10_04550 [Staphylococcus cohnii]